jgi:3-hydroxyisobutyrate dehydrogenase/2-hydroxy-3-oxopropionate reductase
MSTVGVIGLGAMGHPIARRLMEAGHELVVWNRTPGKARSLAERGAVVVDTPADAARRAEAVLIMVSDRQALQDVTEGRDGVAAGVDGSTTVIQMSTVGPEAVEQLASALPEGAALLDAPVLGSVGEAESGSLNVFASGPDQLIDRWTSLLSTLGSVIRVGPLGAGSAAKLVANSTLFGVLGALGEALALAQALGIPRKVAFDVLAVSPLAAQAERRRPVIESGDYPRRFALSLALKDADLVLGAAAARGTELRLQKAAREWLADAERRGWADRDYVAILSYIIESA